MAVHKPPVITFSECQCLAEHKGYELTWTPEHGFCISQRGIVGNRLFTKLRSVRDWLNTQPDRPTESRHAQEHWLRLVANDAICDVLATDPMIGDIRGVLLANARDRCKEASDQLAIGQPAVALHQAEAALRHLLRALVVMRPERPGRCGVTPPAPASVAHIQPFPLLWPEGVQRTKNRYSSQFRVTLAVATKDLLSEVKRFASSHVVTSNVTGLSANLVGTDPGVAIWFVRAKQIRCIACDQYPTVRENIRALTLCIEALRAMDRHSTQVVDMLIASPSNAPQLPQVAGEGRRPWWVVLAVAETAPLEVAEGAYRVLARTMHPDQGGSRDDWDDLQRAIEEARSRRNA